LFYLNKAIKAITNAARQMTDEKTALILVLVFFFSVSFALPISNTENKKETTIYKKVIIIVITSQNTIEKFCICA
jgi:hypothetical protein